MSTVQVSDDGTVLKCSSSLTHCGWKLSERPDKWSKLSSDLYRHVKHMKFLRMERSTVAEARSLSNAGSTSLDFP